MKPFKSNYAPPAKNFLMPEQVSQLQQALKESNQPHVRERILIILLQNNGKPQHEIAKFLGCSPRTVAYWCMHGDPDNLETLLIKGNMSITEKLRLNISNCY
jgi:hypothetical protein